MAERRSRKSSSSGKRKAPTRGTAPSSPDIKALKLMEPSDEAKAHEPSDVDAMGQEKRREVVGHSYGPSRKSQVIFFVAVAALVVLVVGGYMAATAAFDQPPDEYPDQAKWAQPDAGQIPTRSPSGPCGEPGNPYPFPADSPCVTGKNSEAEPPAASTTRSEPSSGRAPGQEQGSGGVTNSGGGEADSSASTAEGN